MRKIKPIVKAWIALLLDILAFVAVSTLAMATSNIILILIYTILLYILAYDTFQAGRFIAKHIK